MPARSNQDLPPIPSHQEIAAAMMDLEADERRRRRHGALASEIAGKLGVQGARRLGRGAVKGSWSGYMAPALRLVPALLAMKRRGLVTGFHEQGTRSRLLYVLTAKGRELASG